ncbi:MAG TPA: aspartate kinase [Gaiellaceae bacterium]
MAVAAAGAVNNLVVQKFGGSSVADPARIKHVAARIAATVAGGASVCVVVSAMGRTTDELIELAAQVSRDPHPRELDMLLTAGEQTSIALLSMALIDRGLPAMSFTGPQAGIVTDSSHGKARIVELRVERVRAALDRGEVAIVAGFQGVSRGRDITTLGRGGSDTTAVALAAALEANACEIYTDVDGVYTADPRLVSEARKLDELSYEEMLDLAACGARVLALRSVEYARSTGVAIHVRSSFDNTEGTWIRKKEELLEHAIISGIAHDTSEAKVTVFGVPDQPGIAAAVFRALADAAINVDMIVQNVSEAGRTDISFTLPETDLDRAESILAGVAEQIEAAGVVSDRKIAKVSLIGAGMKSDPGVAADMFDALAEAGINIGIISTSSIRISCVIASDQVQQAVQAVHDRFKLGESL